MPHGLLVEQCIRQALVTENLGMDAGNQHLLVVGPIEDTDSSALWQIACGAPKEVVLQLNGLGCSKLKTWQPCGFTPDMTCLMRPSLPAASIAWKISRTA